MSIKEFDYVDAKNKHTHRVVWELSPASDKMFALDLTEFEDEEREFLTEQLEALRQVFMEEVRQLGLGSNYRYFKDERISKG